MMTFLATIREVVGWALLGTGLATFGLAGYLVLNQRMACSGLIVTVIGYVVFRGGLHLIKVAVAARAAAEGRAAAGPTPVRKVARPVVAKPTLAAPRAAVLPGPKAAP
jgi:hypothetical protein